MRVYLDTCVLSRLTDKPTHPRITEEADASEQIFQLIYAGKLGWIASSVLEAEVRRNPNRERMIDGLDLLAYAEAMILPGAQAFLRAHEFHKLGYGAIDGLHLALAEQAGADVLLTTDDRFLRVAARGAGDPKVRVENPVEWLRR